MIIPPERLSKDVLHALAEEFITRDGTDYGELELSLSQKCERLIPQIFSGDVVIFFDAESQQTTLMPKEQWQQFGGAGDV